MMSKYQKGGSINESGTLNNSLPPCIIRTIRTAL